MSCAPIDPSEDSKATLFCALSWLAGIIVSGVGVTVLLGWTFDIAILKSVLPGFGAIKANTALALLGGGTSLLLTVSAPLKRSHRIAAMGLAVFVVVIGGTTLLEYVGPIDINVDQLFFRDADSIDSPHPGRMAPATAVMLILNSSAMMLIDVRVRASRLLSFLSLILAAVAVTGYLFSASGLYRIGPHSSVAIQTALCLSVWSLGIWAARPTSGLMRVIASGSAGGILMRTILPVGSVLLLVLGLLFAAGVKAALYVPEMGLALMVVSGIVALLILTAWEASQLHRLDVERQEAADELVTLNQQLNTAVQERTHELAETVAQLKRDRYFRDAIVESATDAIIGKDLNGIVRSWNHEAELLFGYAQDEIIGQPITLIVPPDHVDQESGFIERIKQGDRIQRIETVRRHKNGDAIPVSLTISPINDGSGSVAGASTIAHDLRAEKRAAENFRSLIETAPDAMVIVNAKGEIVLVNTMTESLFGYQRTELLGQQMEVLVPARFRESHTRYRAAYTSSPHPRPMGSGLELFGLRKDGTEFPVEVSLSPMRDAEGTLVTSTIRDVTERKASQQRIMNSLREKEVLLKEIYHRVKNNLAVICSLFYLQGVRAHDPQTVKILQESQERVRAMALVHETLYGSTDLAAIDFGEYASNLSRTLLRSYNVSDSRIQLVKEIERVSMPIEKAVPCGLILNELLSNAMKHAFPAGREGKIKVRVLNRHGACWISVIDNGTGIAARGGDEKPETMGLLLVRSLTTQVDGKFELLPCHPGTEARLIVEVDQGKHNAK